MGVKLQQISELSLRLTDEFIKEHGYMPWKAIKGLRSIFAHQYGRIVINKMWETMSVHIPELKQLCVKIFSSDEVRF